MAHKQRIYLQFDYPGSQSGDKTGLTGIREKKDIMYITGFYNSPSNPSLNTAFLYKGDLRGYRNPEDWHKLNVPSISGRTVTSTNLYGPEILSKNKVRVVGSYTTQETGNTMLGCLYEGTVEGKGVWITLKPTSDTINTIAHSVAGSIVIGNYETDKYSGKAFIYDIESGKYIDITGPPQDNITSITAYCVCSNGSNSYTICGGFSTVDPKESQSDSKAFNLPKDPQPKYLGSGFVLDWDSKTCKFSNWTQYNYPQASITHFEGISLTDRNTYNLSGMATVSGATIAFLATISKRRQGGFLDKIIYQIIQYPGSQSTTGDSVAGSTVIGAYSNANDSSLYGYVSVKL